MTRAVIALCLVLCAAVLAHALPWLLTQRPGLPTLLSVWTLSAMYLAGSHPRRGWTLALLGQIPWALYTYYSGSYGFVWLNIGLTAVYVRNLWLHRPTPPTGKWGLDTSTGRPILVYENCSVIEGNQAQQVLNALSRIPTNGS